MPITGYIVREHELDKLPDKLKRPLNKEEIKKYMSGVGSLIWI